MVLVTNKETSSAIIYIKFGRIKRIIFLRMQCYAEAGLLVLSHSFHVQLASGVSFLTSALFSAATKLLTVTFQALTLIVLKSSWSHFKIFWEFLLNKCAVKSMALIIDRWGVFLHYSSLTQYIQSGLPIWTDGIICVLVPSLKGCPNLEFGLSNDLCMI